MTTPTIRSFRFPVDGTGYAIDIQGDAVLLLVFGPQGWARVPEFSPLPASAGAITDAGGPVKFVDLILEAVNAVLRILQGKPREGDIPEPADPSLQAEVLDRLNDTVVAHMLMDGSIELQVRR